MGESKSSVCGNIDSSEIIVRRIHVFEHCGKCFFFRNFLKRKLQLLPQALRFSQVVNQEVSGLQSQTSEELEQASMLLK